VEDVGSLQMILKTELTENKENKENKNSEFNKNLKNLSHAPGVYLMRNTAHQIIYVGKAKNLYKRVNSYFSREPEDMKTQALVREVESLEVTVTLSEAEALILENHLIKTHRPKYNIIFKDDKSYPYLYLSTQDLFPKLISYRGERKSQGLSFGPYPNVASTRETLKLLQKIFPLRNCEDSFFKTRSRPCLQHQIGRCSAPCVKLITPENYAFDVDQAKLFLEGKSQKIMADLADAMEKASESLEFEKAAKFRDQIKALQKLQTSQAIFSGNAANTDVIALNQNSGCVVVAVLFIRAGRVLGSRIFFPEIPELLELSMGFSKSEEKEALKNIKILPSSSEILMAFLSQFYSSGQGGKDIPSEIILSEEVPENSENLIGPKNIEMADFFSNFEDFLGKKVEIKWGQGVRAIRAKWLEMAKLNAQEALKTRFAGKLMFTQRWEALERLLNIKEIQRMACFDISHSQGESTVASCVIFDQEGPNKKKYRRFNIENAGGDDYAAMAQAVSRYFSRLIKEKSEKPEKFEGSQKFEFPDVLFIDGGAGQLKAAQEALMALNIDPEVDLKLMGVSKAELRKSGFEQLWQIGEKYPLILNPDDHALHLIQEIRDEAHRFAIKAHRKQRLTRRLTSVLEHIPGVGAKRRQALLNYFGSLNLVKSASMDELRKVPGVSISVAKQIYEWARG
jgi:excinuclease ABC subunit C